MKPRALALSPAVNTQAAGGRFHWQGDSLDRREIELPRRAFDVEVDDRVIGVEIDTGAVGHLTHLGARSLGEFDIKAVRLGVVVLRPE